MGNTRKRAQREVSLGNLELDPENPRLSEEDQGQSQKELLKALYKDFNLQELAHSMAQNGYFDEEPLVAVPKKVPKRFSGCTADDVAFQKYATEECEKFMVVEGNRRLSTAQLLSDESLQQAIGVTNWPSLTARVRNDLKQIPVVIYVKREEVTPYLGVRHIIGIQKWDSYAKARYIAKTVDSGISVSDIEKDIGGQRGGARKSQIAYKAVKQLEDEYEDFDTTEVKSNFSLLILAFGQGKIKRFLGFPKKTNEIDLENPVPERNLGQLKEVVTWIFGDGKKRSVISESRDITKYLSHVIESSASLKHLRKTGDLVEAYDFSDGEEELVLRNLSTAGKKLESTLGIVNRHLVPDVREAIEKCNGTVQELMKRTEGIQE